MQGMYCSPADKKMLSIIIPTYNESENILNLLESIRSRVSLSTEVIVVDDNSPDGTADLVEQYARSIDGKEMSVKIVKRDSKQGLISAVIHGLRYAEGKNIVVMDADLSHPSDLIPVMADELINDRYDIVVASRYVDGGATVNWGIRRKIISRVANLLARLMLGIDIKDAVSGFFACKRHVLDGIEFDTRGYKMLLEILVKARGARVKEIPYIFVNRSKGKSKLDSRVALEYLRSLWILYRYGRKRSKERRRSILFLSRAARFYTVGAIGLGVNYVTSMLANMPLADTRLATLIGIAVSITSNFILNKAWTFEDTDFELMHTLKQYAYYASLSSIGGAIQFALVNILINIMEYGMALPLAIAVASAWNFLSNKKWTFKDRLWG